MKKIIVIVVVILIVILSLIFFLSKGISNYNNNLITELVDNYDIDSQDINYINKHNGFYVFTTDSNVVVLNKKYKEVLTEKIDKLSKLKGNYDIIYETDKLMLLTTKVSDKKVVYKYYDALTGKKVKNISIGG